MKPLLPPCLLQKVHGNRPPGTEAPLSKTAREARWDAARTWRRRESRLVYDLLQRQTCAPAAVVSIPWMLTAAAGESAMTARPWSYSPAATVVSTPWALTGAAAGSAMKAKPCSYPMVCQCKSAFSWIPFWMLVFQIAGVKSTPKKAASGTCAVGSGQVWPTSTVCGAPTEGSLFKVCSVGERGLKCGSAFFFKKGTHRPIMFLAVHAMSSNPDRISIELPSSTKLVLSSSRLVSAKKIEAIVPRRRCLIV
jgi:hypothetical protein